jgi:predicted Zn-dependent peptidase
MVEDAPDDLVHEVLTQQFWAGHPLGRPILGTPQTVSSFDADTLRGYFAGHYVASNLIVAAAGNLDHAALRDLVERAFAGLPAGEPVLRSAPPGVTPGLTIREKDIEQAHICLGIPACSQIDEARHATYVMNAILGGSMSSRLFQNVREKRGLAYTVYSGMSAYRDTGSTVVYAGCANEQVEALIDVVVAELRALKREAPPAEELTRACDHLKGSLMLGLESTSSRMAHLARQEIYFDRYFALDETLAAIDAVTGEDVRRVACDLFADDGLSAAVVGDVDGLEIPRERLALG